MGGRGTWPGRIARWSTSGKPGIRRNDDLRALRSGTTLIAAECTGRICYGIDSDPLTAHYSAFLAHGKREATDEREGRQLTI